MKITPEKLNWEFGKAAGFCGKTLLDKENGGLKLVKVIPLVNSIIFINILIKQNLFMYCKETL